MTGIDQAAIRTTARIKTGALFQFILVFMVLSRFIGW
jgi:hypothetical protein